MDVLKFGRGPRLPMFLQNEKAECGLACVGMIAGYYGFQTSLAQLRRFHQGSGRGTTLLQLVGLGRRLGMLARPLKLAVEEIPTLRLPVILHWNNSHYVVLKRVRAGRYELHDPAIGSVTLRREELEKCFTGVALELMPGHGFQVQPKAVPVKVRDVLGRVHGFRQIVTSIAAAALALEVFSFVTPLFTQLVIDKAISSADSDLLFIFGISFCVLVVFQAALGFFREWLVCRAGNVINQSWTAGVFGHLIALPEDYFQRRSLGDIGSRFNSLKSVQYAVTSTITTSLLDGLMSLATLAVMFCYSPKLTVVVIGFACVYVALRLALYSTLKRLNVDLIGAQARQNSRFYEYVRASQVIKANNLISRATTAYLNLVTAFLNKSIVMARVQDRCRSFARSGEDHPFVVRCSAGDTARTHGRDAHVHVDVQPVVCIEGIKAGRWLYRVEVVECTCLADSRHRAH